MIERRIDGGGVEGIEGGQAEARTPENLRKSTTTTTSRTIYSKF